MSTDPEDRWPGWADRLRVAARLGKPIDLAPGKADTESDPPVDGEGLSALEIPAEDIRAVLLEQGLIADPRGLQIRGAVVTGTLDLDHTKLPCRLSFKNCRFIAAPSFEQAIMPELVLKDVTLPGLSLRTARLTGDVTLTRLCSTGEVNAQNIRVGGQLVLTGATLSNGDGKVLNLDTASIDGDALLEQVEAIGEIWVLGARIGGQLDLSGAKLSNPHGIALGLDGADITGHTFLDGLEATGEVRAHGAHMRSQIDLTGAKLTNPGGSALLLDGADITGDAVLEKLEVQGEVRAHGARFGGLLNLSGSKLTNVDGDALTLDRVNICGYTFLDRMDVSGTFRAHEAHVGGQLDLTGAKVTNPGGEALFLERADITGDAVLQGIEVNGKLVAFDAHVGGQLDLSGAKLTNPDGDALVLDRAGITGSALLQDVEVNGRVQASALRAGGQVDLTGSKLTNFAGEALVLYQADISGDVILEGVEARGQVSVPGAQLAGQLVLFGAKLRSPDPDESSLDLSDTTVDTLLLDETFIAEGRTDLSFATIRILSVGDYRPATGLPPLSGAHGWTVRQIHGFLRTDRRTARAWLATIETLPQIDNRREFFSQPWKEMAKIYDQIGQPEDARRIRFWAAHRTTRVAPLPSKLVRWPYGLLVGYGYYPLIVLGWLAALWLTVLILCSLHAPAFTPTDSDFAVVTITTDNRFEEVRVTGATAPPLNYPRFEPGLFAVDTAIPAAATGQANAWRITENTWLPAVFAGIKSFAWLLTALLLAGITGILRKD